MTKCCHDCRVISGERSLFEEHQYSAFCIPGHTQWMDGGQILPCEHEQLRGEYLCVSEGGDDAYTEIFLSAAALLDSIKVCTEQCDLGKGCRIHAEVLKKGLLKRNIHVDTALLCMYAKCGALTKAQEIFDGLLMKDVVSWTTLIGGYVHQGLSDAAVECYDKMRDEGISPDAVTFSCLLKACGNIVAADKGEQIHADVYRQGLLEKNVVLGTALMDMYVKCGALSKAQHVFGELPERNIVSWTVLISGYAQHGFGDKALECFEKMQDDGFFPNAKTYSCVLKACGTTKVIHKGTEIHTEVIKQGLLQRDVVLGTSLVDMYSKCGFLRKAQEVFDKLPTWNIVSWNALLAGYVQHGLEDEALICFEMMVEEGFLPNLVTFLCVLKACSSVGAIEKGEEIHMEVKRQGLLKMDIELGNELIDMYAKCGVLMKARELFDELPAWDVITWNTLIAGYVQQNLAYEALRCFEDMENRGFMPNIGTYICILRACGSIGIDLQVDEIHAELISQGLLGKNVRLGTTLVDAYVKCGEMAKAQKVFDKLPLYDVLSWTALIVGYVHHGLNDEALKCFGKMRIEGFLPDAVTFIFVLKACGNIGETEKGKKIHADIKKQGILENDVAIGTALVEMYAKFGKLGKAQEVFDELSTRNIASWNVLITGYIQQGLANEALTCFQQMQDEGFRPDAVVYICILNACGSIGAVAKAEEVHAQVNQQGLIMDNVVVNALVDMYAKCAKLITAQELFNELLARDIVSWNVLIAAYSQYGKVRKVFESFNRMLEECIEPNMITFNILLTVCSHVGIVVEGQVVFNSMSRYSAIMTPQHYACMVDLFSRAGHFGKAIRVIKRMPCFDCLVTWMTMLSACQKWMNVKLGKWAFGHVLDLDGNFSAALVCMSNFPADFVA